MATCKVRTVKMDAIYNLVKNLLADPNNGVNTPAEVLDWFEKKYGKQITKEEIIDSFVILDQKNLDASKKELANKMGAMRAWARQANRLGLFLENSLQRNTGKKSTDSPETSQIKEVFDQFKELAKKNVITDDDIDLLTSMVQSLPIAGNYDRVAVESALNQLQGLRKLKQEERDAKRVQRMSETLGKLFKGEVKYVKKTKVPDEEHLQEFRNILNELRRYARSDRDITPIQASDIMSRLSEIEQQYAEHYDTDGQASEEAIRNAIQNYREIRKEMQIDSLTKRLNDAKRMINTLNDPDSPDYAAIITDNTGIPWKGKEKEIVLLEAELEDAQEKILAMRESILRKAKARSITSIMGIEELWGIKVQGKGVQGMINFYYAAKQHGWEILRTLKFMFDNSAFFVQLAPIVTIDLVRTLSGYDLARYALGKQTDPFAGLNRAKYVLMEGFIKVIHADWTESEKHPLRSRTSRGSYTVKLYNDIVNHPLYSLMHESGLKISRSRSLSDSEEYFKTNLLNKVPGAGWIKDVSEDVMVSTLNLYRVMLFEKFYEMHPNLTAEEYGKAAEGINNLTGTTKLFGQVLGPAAIVLSAPRLLAAKIKLSLLHPWKAITGLDIPGSIVERRLKYNSAYNAYMVRQMAGIWGSYAFIAGVLLLADLAGAGIAVGGDIEDKDFMRIRHGKRSYDITGGLGAIYRTLALMWYLTTGPSEGASYKAKERINYLRSVKKWDMIWAILGFERTKFHPAISTLASVATGKDFIGRPYASTALGSRLEALGRGVLPIFIESFIFDDLIKEINNPSEILPSFGDAILQFQGINVFEYDSEMQNLEVEKIINKLEYQPDIRYPDGLKERNGKKTADSLAKEYLMMKYKNMYGDALGKLIMENPDITKEQLRSMWNSQKSKVDREFNQKYGEDVKKLKLKE